MRVILRRELIGKAAVVVGTATAPLLAKGASPKLRLTVDQTCPMYDCRPLSMLFTPIIRLLTARTRWVYTAG